MHNQRPSDPVISESCSVLRGAVRIRDIDQYNEFSAPVWDVVRDQLSPGSLQIENTFVSSRNSILYLESTKAAYSVRGKVPDGHVVFGVPIGPAKAARWWGTGYPESSIPCALGGTEFDMAFPEGSGQLIMVVKEDVFCTRFETLAGRGLDFLSRTGHFLPVDPRAFRRFEGELLFLAGAANGNPNADFSLEAFDTRLVSAFADSVGSNVEVRLTKARRKDLIHRALWVIDEANGCLDVSEVCVSAKVSSRTLERAFREHMNLTAAEYIRLHRFNLCHQLLGQAKPGKHSVKKIIATLGFRNLASFATEYRQFFAEFPQETLKRPPKRPSRRLRFGARPARGVSVFDLL